MKNISQCVLMFNRDDCLVCFVLNFADCQIVQSRQICIQYRNQISRLDVFIRIFRIQNKLNRLKWVFVLLNICVSIFVLCRCTIQTCIAFIFHLSSISWNWSCVSISLNSSSVSCKTIFIHKFFNTLFNCDWIHFFSQVNDVLCSCAWQEKIKMSFSIDNSFVSNSFCDCVETIEAIIVVSCSVLRCCACSWNASFCDDVRIVSVEECSDCFHHICTSLWIASICILNRFQKTSNSKTRECSIFTAFICFSFYSWNISEIYLFSVNVLFIIQSNFHIFSSFVWCICEFIISLNVQLSLSLIQSSWKRNLIQNAVWVDCFFVASIDIVSLHNIRFHYR